MNASGTPFTRGRLMSEKYAKAAGQYDPAMSFEEIGRRLGITKQMAYFFFVSGLKKLRRNPKATQLLELAESKDAFRTVRPEDLA